MPNEACAHPLTSRSRVLVTKEHVTEFNYDSGHSEEGPWGSVIWVPGPILHHYSSVHRQHASHDVCDDCGQTVEPSEVFYAK
jgi:hypothetical protein